MNKIIFDTVGRLSDIIKVSPVDWETFDFVLEELEDINIIDQEDEETILSECLLHYELEYRGEILADIVRHFLSHGYDVSANEGKNGCLALIALCWSSCDRHILEAARILMNAGAPLEYKTWDEEEGELTADLISSIERKIPGAWMVDVDYEFGNTLEAYYEMAKANLAGKNYNFIDNYFACIGKTLTSVDVVKNEDIATLKQKGKISQYAAPLVMWFGDKPLIASCYTDFVVNPVYADDQKDNLMDVTEAFSGLIGSVLKKVQYIDRTICYFEFSNGQCLFFTSHNMGDRKRIGTFEICAPCNDIDIGQLKIECICGIAGHNFASTVTEYSENAIALFCDDGAYILYLVPGISCKKIFGISSCSRELLAEYTRQYPLKNDSQILCLYQQNDLKAIRIDYTEGHLYMLATDYDIETQLSDKLYNPVDLKYDILSGMGGKHMEFEKRASSL